jgi:hypothetical protein
MITNPLQLGINNPPVETGTGTVSAVSIVTANGVSGTVANDTTTPAITLKVGAVSVANAAARLALTGFTYGTDVYQTDTGFYYKLITPSSIASEAGWLIQRPVQTAVLEADFPKDDDTLTAVTDLTLTLLAGHWYRVNGQFVVNGSSGGGVKIDFGGGSATATAAFGGYLTFDALNGQAAGGPIISLTYVFAGAFEDYMSVSFDFTVQVNAGGTLIPRFAQATTDAAASTMEPCSTIQCIDVTP